MLYDFLAKMFICLGLGEGMMRRCLFKDELGATANGIERGDVTTPLERVGWFVVCFVWFLIGCNLKALPCSLDY